MSGQVMRAFGARQTPVTPLAGAHANTRPIDLVYLSRQTLGDRGLEVELLGLFERQAGQIIEQITRIDHAGERRTRHDLAHTLKGSARAVGANAVAAAAQTYEECLYSAAGGAENSRALKTLEAAVKEARAAVNELLQDR